MRLDRVVDAAPALLVGIAMVAGEPGMATQRARMLDLPFDGLRPHHRPDDHRS